MFKICFAGLVHTHKNTWTKTPAPTKNEAHETKSMGTMTLARDRGRGEKQRETKGRERSAQLADAFRVNTYCGWIINIFFYSNVIYEDSDLLILYYTWFNLRYVSHLIACIEQHVFGSGWWLLRYCPLPWLFLLLYLWLYFSFCVFLCVFGWNYTARSWYMVTGNAENRK